MMQGMPLCPIHHHENVLKSRLPYSCSYIIIHGNLSHGPHLLLSRGDCHGLGIKWCLAQLRAVGVWDCSQQFANDLRHQGFSSVEFRAQMAADDDLDLAVDSFQHDVEVPAGGHEVGEDQGRDIELADEQGEGLRHGGDLGGAIVVLDRPEEGGDLDLPAPLAQLPVPVYHVPGAPRPGLEEAKVHSANGVVGPVDAANEGERGRLLAGAEAYKGP